MARDFYSVLAVPRNATEDQIRQRFRELARTRHPDRFQGRRSCARRRSSRSSRRRSTCCPTPSGGGGTTSTWCAPRRARRPIPGSSSGSTSSAASRHTRRRIISRRPATSTRHPGRSKSGQAWHHLAQACSHQRNWLSRAVDAIERACQLESMNPGYLKQAGRICALSGQTEKAIQYYRKALEWGDDDATVRQALEELSGSPARARPLRTGSDARQSLRTLGCRAHPGPQRGLLRDRPPAPALRGRRRHGRPQPRRGGLAARRQLDPRLHRPRAPTATPPGRSAWTRDLARHSNLLKMAVRIAHDQVLRAISKDGSLYGMGTTVVGLLLSGSSAAVAHVGDSRAYRLRGGRLEQLTQDHTWVNEQVVAGFLSREQARTAPAQERRHPRPRRRERRPGRRARDGGPARRPLPPLLGRPDRHALRRRHPRPPRLRPQPPRDLPHPDHRLQRPRRH